MTKIEYFIDSYSSVLQLNINTQVEKQNIYKTARVEAIAITELNTSGWPNTSTTTIGQLLAYIFPNEDALIFEPNLPDDVIGGTTVNPVWLDVIAILNGNQSSPTTKELYNKLDKNRNAKLRINDYNRAKDFGGQKWFDGFMRSALTEMKIQKLKMSDFTTPSIFEDSYKDLLANFRRNDVIRATNRYTSIEELYDAFIEAGENYNQPVAATKSGTQSATQSTQSSSKTGDYKITVKDPKTDIGKKIQGSISFTELGPNVTANSVLNNLPNPWTDVRTNLPVSDNTGTITYESFPFSKSTDNYEKILADDSIKVLQSIISDKYGVEILLTYEPVNVEPTQSSPTQSVPTTATASATSSTITDPREYTFDVQIENTFYNSEIGYLTITGKLDDTFVYGDEQDTIDPEYTEVEFLGSEEETLQLSQAAETYKNLQEEIPADTPPSTLNVSETSINYNDPSFKGADWKNFDINTAVRKIQNTSYKAGKFTESLKKVLYLIKNDSQINDLREAAYLLGTAYAESSYSLQRWEADYACTGQGVPYGSSGPCSKATNYYRLTKGKKDYYTLGLDSKGQCFFGRGLIQLTGKANYETYGKLIGVSLVSNGDLALDPINSFKVAVTYMRALTFKFVLANNLTKARKSVNGGDKGLEEVNGAYNAWIKVIKESKADAIA
jgi:hypothetical protein